MREYIKAGLTPTLEVKFGSPGLELMPQISKITDLERLSEILRSILTSNTLEEVQNLLQKYTQNG